MNLFKSIEKLDKKKKLIIKTGLIVTLIIAITSVIIITFKNSKKTQKEVKTNIETNLGDKYDKQNRKFESKIKEVAVQLQDSEEVTEEQLEEEQVNPDEVKTGNATYYIKVNYGANTVTIYGKDENDEYTVPVKAMICSCGISTPKSGVYKTSDGYEWGTLIGGVYGQYSTRIVGNILFHSVPYTDQSSDSLEYWEFDKLGTKASAGCVRLMVGDAKWIFYNCERGTMVEFYSSDDPGPLGKPVAPKISDNIACRDWDPTDDVEGNPWFNEIVEEPIEQELPEETKITDQEPISNQIIESPPKKEEPKNQIKPVENTAKPPENLIEPQNIVENITIPTNTITDSQNTIDDNNDDNENIVNEITETENEEVDNTISNEVEKEPQVVENNEVNPN